MSNSIIPEGVTTKWVATLLTIIGFAIAAVLWATNAHSELKEWTAEQDFVTKQELKEVMEDRYVPLSEYVELRTRLENLCENSAKIDERLERIEAKINKRSR